MVNKLKILQYPNIRHRAPYRYCRYDKTHPRNFEPAFHCGQNPCDSCEAMRLARDWTNTCYEMQHRVCTRAEAEGRFSESAKRGFQKIKILSSPYR